MTEEGNLGKKRTFPGKEGSGLKRKDLVLEKKRERSPRSWLWAGSGQALDGGGLELAWEPPHQPPAFPNPRAVPSCFPGCPPSQGNVTGASAIRMNLSLAEQEMQMTNEH